jgi:hypothetical protein
MRHERVSCAGETHRKYRKHSSSVIGWNGSGLAVRDAFLLARACRSVDVRLLCVLDTCSDGSCSSALACRCHFHRVCHATVLHTYKTGAVKCGFMSGLAAAWAQRDVQTLRRNEIDAEPIPSRVERGSSAGRAVSSATDATRPCEECQLPSLDLGTRL